MTATTAGNLEADQMVVPPKPVPVSGNSLTASSRRLTSKTLQKSKGVGKSTSWQEDAWDMYDLVGEQRFLANTLANRMSQARFFVGKRPADSTEEIEPVNEGPAYEAFQSLAKRPAQLAQIVKRCGLNLFMPGDAYLVGIPQTVPDKVDGISPVAVRAVSDPEKDPLSDIDISDLDWHLHSVHEVKPDDTKGEVDISGPEGAKTYKVDNIILIRIWNSHPKIWWEADSPTRSSLPVLRELVGLTMHVSAQVDSRLAGAGVFFIPAEADAAMRAATNTAPGEPSPLAQAIQDAMSAAIGDRNNASALVPVMPVVPADYIDKFKHIAFSGVLDKEARALRDEAIRRLALGQDCPPELLLGVAGMNHWGAWLVREDVVTTHLEPPLALFCDAVTTQFLWLVLEQQGIENFDEYVVWYDVDHLIMRPNRAQDAKDAKNMGIISDASTRDALGFDESDAPEVEPTDPVIQLTMDMIRTAPSLAQNPGISLLAEQIRAMLEGKVIEAGVEQVSGEDAEKVDTPAEGAETPEEGGTPSTNDTPPEEPSE